MSTIQPIKSTKINKPLNLKANLNLEQLQISKEDLEMFVQKYEKESKLSFFRGLPPEINLIKNVALKYKAFFSDRTLISLEDKEILVSMMAMNRDYRTDINIPERLRDKIIDSMINYFGMNEYFNLRYTHFQDYI